MPKRIRTKAKRLSTPKVNRRERLKKFLIVCEGKRTEPFYFEGFRFKVSVTLRIEGLGYNTIRLVRETIRLMNLGEYDQVWCVFDRDSFSPQNFNNALHLAEKEEIKVAYSNEAFELWYLLHFHYHQSATSRHDYEDKLSKELDSKYQKHSRDMYETLEDKQPNAIRNAENLLKFHKRYGRQHNPEKDNPCTTVHLLVQELNKLIR